MGNKRFHRSLYGQVLIAITIGIALGHLYPDAATAMKPLGDGFIKLVRMIIAPIVFCTVVLGIAGMKDMKRVGKAGALALVYFEIVSTLALVIGLVVVNLVQPGAGMNVDPATLDSDALAQYTTSRGVQSAPEFLLNVIPSSAVDAFARSDILQVLLFSILFGFALHRAGEKGALLFDVISKVSHVFFAIVGMIMRLAPVGAFGAIAFTVGNFGMAALAQLGTLIGCFYVACLTFVFLVLNAIAWWHGFSLWRFIRYIKEEVFVVFGTSSSESVLPRMLAKLERIGVEKSVVGLVIPAGYSFNLDGTSIYLSIATIFIAQATNTPLDLGQQLALLAVLLITSKGSAAVAGASLITIVATLSAVGSVPVAGVALILGIHRLMGEAISVTNLIGNGVATIVVASWCGELDRRQLSACLAPKTVDETEKRERVLEAATRPLATVDEDRVS